jgi:hypothetical protein
MATPGFILRKARKRHYDRFGHLSDDDDNKDEKKAVKRQKQVSETTFVETTTTSSSHPSSAVASPKQVTIDELKDAYQKQNKKTGLIGGILKVARRLHGIYKKRSDEAFIMAVGLPFMESVNNGGRRGQSIVRGDLILQEFKNMFAIFKINRYKPQMLMIEAATASLIPQMFGATFSENQQRISETYGYIDFRKVLIGTMPRRCGKTSVASMIEAAAQYVMQGQTAIFAAFFFQSSEFKNLIYHFFCQLPDATDRVVGNNHKEILISRKKIKHDPEGGRIHAFAGKAASARGFKAHRMWFDEAGHADGNHITSNIFAGLLLENAFAGLISSPPDETTSIFNQMCRIQDDNGNYVFKWVRVEAMCDDCRRAKLIKCSHMDFVNPPWHGSAEDRKLIEVVLGTIDPRRYRIEILGVAEGLDLDAFPLEHITSIQTANHVYFRRPPQYIAVCIDPSGGGGSDTAIVAVAKDDTQRFVVGVTSGCCCAYAAALPNGS